MGVPVRARVELPPGLSFGTHQVWGELIRLGGYTLGCREYDQLTVFAELPMLDGYIDFAAPPAPGRYELRLYRSVLESRSGQGVGDQLLARTRLEVIVEPLPGAVQMATTSLSPDDAVEVTVDIPPERLGTAFELQLAHAPDVGPGGGEMLVPMHAPLRPLGPSVNNETVEVTAPQTQLALEALTGVGAYEIRLFQIGRDARLNTGDRFAVDRVRFQVVDPTAPPYPAGTEPRTPAVTDWPEPGDPQRDTDVWWVPASDCVDPEFPQPPIFRLVQWRGLDPESERDVYEPIDGAFKGHPFLIEALFETAPPEDEYRVTLGDRRRVTIIRTADPKLYRSELLVLTEEPSP
jgi:hypothetical protein